MRRCWFMAFLLVPLFGGCTQYQYELTQPRELAQPLSGKSAVDVPIEPLTYELQIADNRLVMQIHNDADEAIKLVGDDSYVVDPEGESHPLQSTTIAPQSSAKLILPPQQLIERQRSPVFGFGVGVGFSSAYPLRRGYWNSALDEVDAPRYYAVEDGGTRFWEWKGEGAIRMRLTYERGEKRWHHELQFSRRKV